MRVATLAPLLVLGACAAGDTAGPIRHRSAMQQQTRGLVLHEGGERGHAGMFSTNCPFETQMGRVTGDYDLPDDGEEVQDGGPSDLGPETVVLVIPDTLYLLEKSTGDYVHEATPWKGLVASRLTDVGVVGLVEDGGVCTVQWREGDHVTATVEVQDCDPSGFDASGDGTVFVAHEGGGRLVRPDTSVDVADGGRLVAFDDVVGVVYRGRIGDSEVSALDPVSGDVVWTTTVDGSLQALAAAGGQGAAIASVERTDGTGAIVWLDGWTGQELTEVDTPSAAPGLTASPDGGTLALVLAEEAHFYSVDLADLYR